MLFLLLLLDLPPSGSRLGFDNDEKWIAYSDSASKTGVEKVVKENNSTFGPPLH